MANRQYRFVFTRFRQTTILAVLAGVTVFTFVFAGLVATFLRPSTKPDALATLGEETFTQRDLDIARSDTYVHFCIATGSRPDTTSDEARELIEELAWKRLVTLRLAEDMEIVTGDEELKESLAAEFSPQGAYDARIYQRFLAKLRSDFGIMHYGFETYYRKQLTIRKVRAIIGQAAWVTPFELYRHMTQYTDAFVVDIALLPLDIIDTDIEVTEADAAAFYGSNKRMFTVPEKRRVRYIEFPVSNYLDRVTVTDAEIEQYYEDNDTDYESEDTNGIITQLTLEEVKSGIVSNISHIKATELAEDDAMDIVLDMTPEQRQPGRKMQDIAKEAGLTVLRSGYFSLTEDIPGIDNSAPEINREVFDLVPDDPNGYFTDPLITDSSVLVIALDDVLEKYIPELEAVSNRVYGYARDQKQAVAYADRAKSMKRDLRKAVRAGKAFTNAVRDLELESLRTDSFTWFSPPTNVPFSQELLEDVVNRQQGEFTDPIEWTNGYALAYVTERTTSELGINPNLRLYVSRSLREKRSGLLFDAWQRARTEELVFESEAE